jgi:hypothetical protein
MRRNVNHNVCVNKINIYTLITLRRISLLDFESSAVTTFKVNETSLILCVLIIYILDYALVSVKSRQPSDDT